MGAFSNPCDEFPLPPRNYPPHYRPPQLLHRPKTPPLNPLPNPRFRVQFPFSPGPLKKGSPCVAHAHHACANPRPRHRPQRLLRRLLHHGRYSLAGAPSASSPPSSSSTASRHSTPKWKITPAESSAIPPPSPHRTLPHPLRLPTLEPLCRPCQKRSADSANRNPIFKHLNFLDLAAMDHAKHPDPHHPACGSSSPWSSPSPPSPSRLTALVLMAWGQDALSFPHLHAHHVPSSPITAYARLMFTVLQ